MALATGLDDLFFSPIHYLSLSLSHSPSVFTYFPEKQPLLSHLLNNE